MVATRSNLGVNLMVGDGSRAIRRDWPTYGNVIWRPGIVGKAHKKQLKPSCQTASQSRRRDTSLRLKRRLFSDPRDFAERVAGYQQASAETKSGKERSRVAHATIRIYTYIKTGGVRWANPSIAKPSAC